MSAITFTSSCSASCTEHRGGDRRQQDRWDTKGGKKGNKHRTQFDLGGISDTFVLELGFFKHSNLILSAKLKVFNLSICNQILEDTLQMLQAGEIF